MKFLDRVQAGAELAAALAGYRHRSLVILGLTRGGVVPAAEVSRQLQVPLDIIVARKIGHHSSAEYAVGAVADGGEPVWAPGAAELASSPWGRERAQAARDESAGLRRRYVGDRRPLPLVGRTAVIVDDGVATGLTMQAAVRAAWRRGAAQVVAAVPVAPDMAITELSHLATAIVVLHRAGPGFQAVSQYYDYFDQVSDEEVRQLLEAYQDAANPKELVDLESLNAVLATIQRYPISSEAIAKKAKALHAAANVVNFFESIPGGTSFRDKKDVMNRTYEVEVLAEQEQEEPEDHPRNY